MNQTIGRYTIIGRLGKGGMGDVYRAKAAGTEIALKMITDPSQMQMTDRFLREVEMLRELQHPNLVRIYDHGICDEGLFYCMEIVEGEELRKLIDGERPFAKLQSIFIQLCDALAFLATKGAVHRDLKPENIFVAADIPKIIDFGLGKMLADESGLTATGQILGTPAYMAQEQLIGKHVTPAADLFALGVMLYEWFAKKRPFGGANLSQMLAALQAGQFIPLGQRVVKSLAS